MSKRPTTLATQAAALCRIDRGHAVTDTPTISKQFGRRHDNVMRDVQALFASVDLLRDEEINPLLTGAPEAPVPLETVEVDGAFVVVAGPNSGPADLLKTEEIKKRGKAGAKEKISEAMRAKTRADKRAFVYQNFFPTTYRDNGREYPAYVVTEVGFQELTRVYKTDLADAARLDFYRAFEYRKTRAINERALHLSIGWKETRDYTKGMRSELTEAIDRHVKRAFEMGSKNAKRYFETITLLIHSNLFRTDDEKYDELRDRLVPAQLVTLATVETAAAKALNEAINADLPYKGPGGCYEAVQKRVLMLCSALGRTYVPPEAPAAPALDFGVPSALPQRKVA